MRTFMQTLNRSDRKPPGLQRQEAGRLALQPKLTIGQPGDTYEQEADRVADQVMRMPGPSLSIGTAPTQISRKCAACEEEDKKNLQMKPAGARAAAGGEAPPIVREALQQPGQPLDAATRAFFEPRFGHDFGAVRVHTDGKSAESARRVNALAYTVGRHIAFAEGRYAPQAVEGRRLIAHELAHTIHQGGQTTAALHRPGAILQRQGDQKDDSVPPGAATDPTQAVAANDEGQNRDSDIETTAQGPTAPPSAPAATTVPEITLETGNVGAGPLNNLVHQQICADTGSGTGKQCFSFAAVGAQLPEFSSTWLGWNSVVVGAILQGQVYHPHPVPGATIASRHTPTAAQVANWLAYMRGTRLGLQDGYSVARHNCRLFSQWEFRDAPSHW